MGKWQRANSYFRTGELVDQDITKSGSTTALQKKLTAGIYDLEIKLTSTGITEVLNTYTDKVYIFAGITTTKSLSLNANPIYDIAYKFVDESLVPAGESGPANYTRKTATISLPAATVTKIGYTFTGWYEDASTSTTAVGSIPNGSTGAKTYYCA